MMEHPANGCERPPATGAGDRTSRSHKPPHLSPLPSVVEGSVKSHRSESDRVVYLTAKQPPTIDRSSPKSDLDRAENNTSFIFTKPETLPLRALDRISRQRVVVVAPHPNNETLSCGGAISLMCKRGYDVKVLVVSDGTMSHPNSRKYPAPALQSLRERETIAALSILGVSRSSIAFLGLKDGSIPSLTSAHFSSAKALCQMYFKRVMPDTILLPWQGDLDTDRRATWQLIQATILGLGISPQTIEYPIWDGDKYQHSVINTDLQQAWRLDIGAAIDRKLQAIVAYRSQLGRVIDDDPEGFYLSADLLAKFTRPWEVYIEEVI